MNPLAMPAIIPARMTPFGTTLIPERFGERRVLADGRDVAKTASRTLFVSGAVV